jgi:hypothetical protein
LFIDRRGPGRTRKITDAELVCLAVAQVLLDCPGDRKFMAWARWRLGHLFPYLPKQPGYNKRIRALAPQVARLLNLLIFESTSIHDELWLIDGTPIACGQSRQTSRALGTGGLCRLRVLQEPAPPLLGLQTRAGLRPGRDADRL